MIEIMKKIAARSSDLYGAKVPTFAVRGDSVTRSCFALYMKSDGLFLPVPRRKDV